MRGFRVNVALVSMALALAPSVAEAQTPAAQSTPASQAPPVGWAPPAPSSPAGRPYVSGEVPWGYRIESRPFYELAIPGAAVLLGGVIMVTYASVQADKIDCTLGEDCDSKKGKYLGASMIGGGMIVTGFIVGFIGFAIRKEKLVRDPSVPSMPTRPSGNVGSSLSIGAVGRSGLGLVVDTPF